MSRLLVRFRHGVAIFGFGLCLPGCPLTVDDPYEIRKPDAEAASGGTGAGESCNDNVKNGNETDTDCGGKTCPACGAWRACKSGADCVSNDCRGGTCNP